MKFAKQLEEGSPELHALYKQLKKSLRLVDAPADEGSSVAPGQLLSAAAATSSSDDDDEAGPAAAVAHQRQQQQQQEGVDLPQQPWQQQQQQQQQQPAQQAPQPLDAEAEARFVSLVEQCVGELNEDYLQREEEVVIKADLAAQAAAAAHSREERLQAYRRVADVHGELVLLCHWSMLAYTGLVKILKKHHKRTGERVRSALLTNLLAQPFCCLDEVRGLVRQAEAQIAQLAAALGLPASQAPTAGAAAAAAVRDPAAQPEVATALTRGSSPAVGDSGAAQQQEQEQAAAALPPLAVAMVATCGSAGAAPAPQEDPDPPRIKRFRSKVLSRPGKRQERQPGSGAADDGACSPLASARQGRSGGAAASSGASSMQVSGQPSASEGGTPRASGQEGDSVGTPRSGGGGGAFGGSEAAPGQRRSIMQRTKAALQLWKALRTTAHTPSTVAPVQVGGDGDEFQ